MSQVLVPTSRLLTACQSYIDGNCEWGDIEIESAMIEAGFMSEDDMVESCEIFKNHAGTPAVLVCLSNEAEYSIAPSTAVVNRC